MAAVWDPREDVDEVDDEGDDEQQEAGLFWLRITHYALSAVRRTARITHA